MKFVNIGNVRDEARRNQFRNRRFAETFNIHCVAPDEVEQVIFKLRGTIRVDTAEICGSFFAFEFVVADGTLVGNFVRRGIFGVGSAAARDLIRHFGGLDELSKATVDKLQLVPDIGEKTAQRIKNFFDDADNVKLLAELKTLGLTFTAEQKIFDDDSPIAGKIFVLTGTLANHTRDEASKLLEERGGIVKNSVTKTTNYLIVGDNPGSKLTKAESLGVTILSEDDFEKLLTE